MIFHTLYKKTKVSADHFLKRQNGSISLLFAAALPVLIIVTGLAVDYGRLINLKSKLQTSTDAAVLAASNPSLLDANRQHVFDSYLASNVENGIEIKTSRFAYAQASGGSAVVSIMAENMFLGIIGQPYTPITVQSTAKFEKTDIEVVFVLDSSGSMYWEQRLVAVKAAAINMMDSLKKSMPPGGTVKFALVPFAFAINIGTNRADLVAGTDNALFSKSGWGGCVLERPNNQHYTDTYNVGATDGSGRWPAYLWPPEPNVGYCQNCSDGTNSGYKNAEPWPLAAPVWTPGPNFNCLRNPIEPLTDNQATIETAIKALTSWNNTGTTYGPAVSWAMRILSPQPPFTEGLPYSRNTKKIIILLTDGALVIDGGNTSASTNSVTPYHFDPASLGLQGRKLTSAPKLNSFTPYGYLIDSDPYNQGIYDRNTADAELDRLSVEACTEAKKQGAASRPIEIYSIAAGSYTAPGTRAYTTLAACATSSSHIFHAAQSSDIDTVFKRIGQNISQLRLSR